MAGRKRWPDPPDTSQYATEVALPVLVNPEQDRTGGAVLMVLKGSDAGTVELIGPEGGVVGRSPALDVSFDDSSVSRNHARFERIDEGYRLLDLGSANGTFVDGQRVQTFVDLPDSCSIRLGPHTELQYTLVNEAGARAVADLRRSLLIDPLTGVGKRSFLERRIGEELAYAQRHETTVGLMMLDVDHFKEVNDRHGHLVGDQLLRRFAATLLDTVRTEDCVFRYGGDEFCILVRHQSRMGLLAMAERIRLAVEGIDMEHDGTAGRVTTSVGVAAARPGDQIFRETMEVVADEPEEDDDPDLVAIADQALLAAKREGKNRVFALWE